MSVSAGRGSLADNHAPMTETAPPRRISKPRIALMVVIDVIAVAMAVGLTRPRGARITRVTPGSPAEAARLQAGDIILRYNGVRIDNDSHLISLVSLTEVGKEVPLQIFRDRSAVEILVKVGKAPPKAE